MKSHVCGSTQDVTFRNSDSSVIYSISLRDSCAVPWMFSAVLLSHTTSSVLTARLGWDGLAAKGECFRKWHWEPSIVPQEARARGF